MRRTRRRIACSSLAAVFFVAAGSSEATLIDLGRATRDLDAGLDWLDLTETVGFSFNEIIGGAGGLLDAGWTFATGSQVCDLISRHALAPSPCPTPLDDFMFGEGNINEPLIELLGVTELNLGGKTSTGIFDNGSDPLGRAFLYFEATSNLSISAIWESHALFSPTFKNPSVGSFLIRPVPEPVAGLSFMLGLLAIAFMRSWSRDRRPTSR